MSVSDGALDFAGCLALVAGYMRAQGWSLIDARTLAERIWPELRGCDLSSEDATKAVRTATWQHYAAVMYDCCRQADSKIREKAWTELSDWMAQKARARLANTAERQDVVQDALIKLQNVFAEDSLQAPRALWALALKTLKNVEISRHRKCVAQKRGSGEVASLEAERTKQRTPYRPRMPLREAPEASSRRPLEDIVVNRMLYRQIEALFQEHLRSEDQVVVAGAYFLDGLKPSEIAGLLGKSPHEVRMLKSRAVRTLRALPPPDKARLLAMLDRARGDVS